mmetsp:Transcript_2252/g.6444  ORF Transcript_2252/g.6444 Transcript_2252/m.6444 type:complete len:214 (+) Transcript_2252:1270-1911(+)
MCPHASPGRRTASHTEPMRRGSPNGDSQIHRHTLRHITSSRPRHRCPDTAVRRATRCKSHVRSLRALDRRDLAWQLPQLRWQRRQTRGAANRQSGRLHATPELVHLLWSLAECFCPHATTVEPARSQEPRKLRHLDHVSLCPGLTQAIGLVAPRPPLAHTHAAVCRVQRPNVHVAATSVVGVPKTRLRHNAQHSAEEQPGDGIIDSKYGEYRV